jgi:hypothetical protein
MEYDRSKLTFEDRTEEIWINVPKTSTAPPPLEAFSAEGPAFEAYRRVSGYHTPERAKLHRPSLQPIYGGPTLIEALWAEMDRLMEGLMTKTEAEDGGDRFRAQELAWVLAIVTNAYNPSVDRIRAEAVARWNAAEREAALQEEALNPDEQEDVG